MSTAEVGQRSSVQQESQTSARGITQESAFDVLSCERRRYVLHHLLRDERTLELRELSEQVAAWENDIDIKTVTYDQRMRVYTSLRQLHLPKLDEEKLVDYDENRGTVMLTDEAEELEVYLDIVPHKDIRWSKYYLGLGLLSAGGVAGAILGAVPLSFVPGMGWAAIVTALYLVSAVIHYRHDTNNRLGTGEEPPL